MNGGSDAMLKAIKVACEGTSCDMLSAAASSLNGAAAQTRKEHVKALMC
jgi:hypothetical protein